MDIAFGFDRDATRFPAIAHQQGTTRGTAAERPAHLIKADHETADVIEETAIPVEGVTRRPRVR